MASDMTASSPPPPTSSSTHPEGAAPGPTNAQFLLGLFIVSNIIFLFVMNVFELFKDLSWLVDTDTPAAKVATRLALDLPREDASHAGEVYRMANRYAEITALNQSWCLFAPAVFDSGSFADIEMRWDDEPAGAPAPVGTRSALLLPDLNAPGDLQSYVRLGKSRLRKYESNIVVHVKREKDESEEEMKQRWGRTIKKLFVKQWDTMQAYMNWRWRLWREASPDEPTPRQIILLSRCYWIPEPGEQPFAWEGPYIVPVARWRPEHEDYVEMFDPVSRSYVSRSQALK
jgi:hypothetical protein